MKLIELWHKAVKCSQCGKTVDGVEFTFEITYTGEKNETMEEDFSICWDCLKDFSGRRAVK